MTLTILLMGQWIEYFLMKLEIIVLVYVFYNKCYNQIFMYFHLLY